MALSFSEKRALQKAIAVNLANLQASELSFADKRKYQKEIQDAFVKLKETLGISSNNDETSQDGGPDIDAMINAVVDHGGAVLEKTDYGLIAFTLHGGLGGKATLSYSSGEGYRVSYGENGEGQMDYYGTPYDAVEAYRNRVAAVEPPQNQKLADLIAGKYNNEPPDGFLKVLMEIIDEINTVDPVKPPTINYVEANKDKVNAIMESVLGKAFGILWDATKAYSEAKQTLREARERNPLKPMSKEWQRKSGQLDEAQKNLWVLEDAAKKEGLTIKWHGLKAAEEPGDVLTERILRGLLLKRNAPVAHVIISKTGKIELLTEPSDKLLGPPLTEKEIRLLVKHYAKFGEASVFALRNDKSPAAEKDGAEKGDSYDEAAQRKTITQVKDAAKKSGLEVKWKGTDMGESEHVHQAVFVKGGKEVGRVMVDELGRASFESGKFKSLSPTFDKRQINSAIEDIAIGTGKKLSNINK